MKQVRFFTEGFVLQLEVAGSERDVDLDCGFSFLIKGAGVLQG